MVVFRRRFCPWDDGHQHQCAVFSYYWVRCSLLDPRMHPQRPPSAKAAALPECLTNHPLLSVSPSHSLLSQFQSPRSCSSVSSGSMAPSPRVEHRLWWAVAHPPSLQHKVALGGRAVEEQRARQRQWGPARVGAVAVEQCPRRRIPQRQRSSCISIRGTRCIFFLLVPHCFITCCLRVYWISFRDWVLIWSSIG